MICVIHYFITKLKNKMYVILRVPLTEGLFKLICFKNDVHAKGYIYNIRAKTESTFYFTGIHDPETMPSRDLNVLCFCFCRMLWA